MYHAIRTIHGCSIAKDKNKHLSKKYIRRASSIQTKASDPQRRSTVLVALCCTMPPIVLTPAAVGNSIFWRRFRICKNFALSIGFSSCFSFQWWKNVKTSRCSSFPSTWPFKPALQTMLQTRKTIFLQLPVIQPFHYRSNNLVQEPGGFFSNGPTKPTNDWGCWPSYPCWNRWPVGGRGSPIYNLSWNEQRKKVPEISGDSYPTGINRTGIKNLYLIDFWGKLR